MAITCSGSWSGAGGDCSGILDIYGCIAYPFSLCCHWNGSACVGASCPSNSPGSTICGGCTCNGDLTISTGGAFVFMQYLQYGSMLPATVTGALKLTGGTTAIAAPLAGVIGGESVTIGSLQMVTGAALQIPKPAGSACVLNIA